MFKIFSKFFKSKNLPMTYLKELITMCSNISQNYGFYSSKNGTIHVSFVGGILGSPVMVCRFKGKVNYLSETSISSICPQCFKKVKEAYKKNHETKEIYI